jgi:hypothetical protein
MDAPEKISRNGSAELMKTTVDQELLNKIVEFLTVYQKGMNPASREDYLDCAIQRADAEKALRAIGAQLDSEGSILLMRGAHLQVKKQNPVLAAYLQTIWNGVGCWPA